MSTISSVGACRRHPLPYYVATFFLSAALLLSIFSYLNMCTSACESEHTYRLFGLPFEAVGIPFFAALLLLHTLGWRQRHLSRLKEYLIAAALGAEVVFIAVQKFEVGSWCPLCLAIAAAIFFAAWALAWEGRWRYREESRISTYEENPPMSYKRISLFAAALSGFLIAFTGISPGNAMEAVEKDVKDKLVLGKSSSPIEIYIFTDWFCPPCRKLEPTLATLVPEVTEQARVSFIDVAVHPESLDFVPYNMSFMIYNKPQYLQLREVLQDIAKSNKKPTKLQIKDAAQKIGVALQELDFADIAIGLDYFQEMTKKFAIDGTPMVVVVNHKTNEQRKLEGLGDVTKENVKRAIEELSK